MIVYLLRHGIAEDHAACGRDAERALTEEGRQRLESATKGWCRLVDHVDRILASPLVRAQQTARVFQQAVAREVPIESERALEPAARPLDMLHVLAHAQGTGTRGIACVGHEPHLGGLLGVLLTGNERTAIPFKKGMLVAVEIESGAAMLGRLVAAVSQRLAGA